MAYFHGGIPGLRPGDQLLPAPPHLTDGCPICAARAEGRALTVGEFRAFIRAQAEGAPAHKRATADQVLSMLDGAPDHIPVDPPTAQTDSVYVTTDLVYARWYAARSGHGDLYRVQPAHPFERTTGEDSGWDTYTAPSATVLQVIARGVHLRRAARRELAREWKRRDRAAGLEVA